MRITVNRELCRGHGVCAGNAPDVFDVDDEGKAYVLHDVVPAGREEDARMGVHNCPEQAIELS